MIWLTVR